MTDTTCPSCDAPAPPGASRCARCGYRFLEDVGTIPRPRPSGRGLAAGAVAAALVAMVVVAAVLLSGSDGADDEATAGSAVGQVHLQVVSRHPLSKAAAERALTELYLAIPDDDQSDVRCARREPRPAHSVRRCHILYPGGTERTIVVITNANGSEVLSEP